MMFMEQCYVTFFAYVMSFILIMIFLSPSFLVDHGVPATLLCTKWLLYYRGRFVSCSKWQSSCNLQATAPYKHHCVVISCANKNENKTHGAYDYITHQTSVFLPRLHLLQVQGLVWLTSCRAASVALSLYYMQAILIKILYTDDLHVYKYCISSNSNRNYYWLGYLPSATTKRGCRQNEDDYY